MPPSSQPDRGEASCGTRTQGSPLSAGAEVLAPDPGGGSSVPGRGQDWPVRVSDTRRLLRARTVNPAGTARAGSGHLSRHRVLSQPTSGRRSNRASTRPRQRGRPGARGGGVREASGLLRPGGLRPSRARRAGPPPGWRTKEGQQRRLSRLARGGPREGVPSWTPSCRGPGVGAKPGEAGCPLDDEGPDFGGRSC